MKFKDCLQSNAETDIPNYTVAGIDIGSRQAKAVLLHEKEIYTAILPTGFYMQQTANELLDILYKESGLSVKNLDYIVVTGYGRVSLDFEDVNYRPVTEIACHGMGAHFLGENIRTIIDIGGQDSKAIKVDPVDGKVLDFAMNEKCAAGTGRFLEKIAAVLGYDVEEIGEASLQSTQKINIDSTCVVFAESEVVSSRAKGVPAPDIAAGIHRSVAKRVNGLLQRVGIESNVLFTGGVSNNIGMKKAFEEILGVTIAESKLNTVFAGALGAAVYAADYAKRKLPILARLDSEHIPQTDMTSFRTVADKARAAYENKSAGKKANAAYTCVYTPIEVLGAANVSYMRFMHKGTQEELIAGEGLTQSMLCDLTKSIVGGFMKQTPMYVATDRLYTFNTCGCMRNSVEAIKSTYCDAEIFNLPRRKNDSSGLEYLTSEIKAFKENLEELTGEEIPENEIRRCVRSFNQAKKLLREIAEFRKGPAPLITSSDFQELTHALFYVPVEELIPELEKIKIQLKQKPKPQKRKIRLMLAGGDISVGDNKVTKILEQDLGTSIVVEDNCSGMKPISTDINDKAENIYEAIAEGYLNKAPCGRMYPIEDMLQYSLKLAQEYDVDGVVLYYLKFCPCYSMIEKNYAELFREHNIPLIILSGDYSVGDEGQMKTRLEAFVEMLQERRDS